MTFGQIYGTQQLEKFYLGALLPEIIIDLRRTKIGLLDAY
jgi:hypothetical protein